MDRINLKVRCMERRVLAFNISRTMPMYKLMKAYAEYYKLSLKNIYFRANTLRVGDHDTAEFLGLRNGDVLQVRSNYYQYPSNEE